VTGAELIRRLRRHARRVGIPLRVDESRGKGSHARIYFGTAFTTVPDRRKEIGPGLLRKMLRDLGLNLKDLG